MRDILRSSADKIDKTHGRYEDGYSIRYGFGRVERRGSRLVCATTKGRAQAARGQEAVSALPRRRSGCVGHRLHYARPVMKRRDFIAALGRLAGRRDASRPLRSRPQRGPRHRQAADDHPARYRDAGAIADPAELRLSHRGGRRSHRLGPRAGRASAPDRERTSHDRHDPRVLHPPPLRPLHGLRASGAPALGSGRRSDSRSATSTDRRPWRA